ncbi:MAG: flippase-like domain-containing protein, partial [Nitrosarchaeum sp.]
TKIKFVNKLLSNLDESRESFIKLNTKKNISEAIAWGLAAKFTHLVIIYFIFLSYGIDLGFLLSGQIYYTSLIFGTITFIPAGIVVTESSMIGLLLEHNVEFATATLIVIFSRIITMWLTTFIGIFMLKLGFRNYTE